LRVGPLCRNEQARVYRSCGLLFYNDVSSIYNQESKVNQLIAPVAVFGDVL